MFVLYRGICSFKNFQFKVSISSYLPLKYGVPQGSVLVYVCVLLFINDLSNIQYLCHFKLYQMIQLLHSLIKIC